MLDDKFYVKHILSFLVVRGGVFSASLRVTPHGPSFEHSQFHSFAYLLISAGSV